jgi:hypothetical protein
MGCRSKADYVRYNKCVETGHSLNKKFYVDGHVNTSEGAHIYECPNDVTVVIFNNEAQP